MDEFVAALVANGAEPSLAGELDLFGRLVGAWRVENRYRPAPDAEWSSAQREWIFSWIVGGRAVQDVIAGGPVGRETAGTTVRAYDTRIRAWRVNWFGTANANYCALIARPHGEDGIRQDGVEYLPEGEIPIRWNFSAISDDSFTWDGWSSADGGESWWLEQHMDARRIA